MHLRWTLRSPYRNIRHLKDLVILHFVLICRRRSPELGNMTQYLWSKAILGFQNLNSILSYERKFSKRNLISGKSWDKVDSENKANFVVDKILLLKIFHFFLTKVEYYFQPEISKIKAFIDVSSVAILYLPTQQIL